MGYWIGYYEGNAKSKRVQKKCGFRYQWKKENVDGPLMHEKRTEHVSLMTKEDWQKINDFRDNVTGKRRGR